MILIYYMFFGKQNYKYFAVLADFQTKNVFLRLKRIMFGHNFTCKTIAMIQQALGEKIVEVVK